ncbi:hypothetical protein BJG92_00847 [Arthrobacter sp. SO5]|uniref:hypothetical protein n=1 Tax=Arthrobacter sp. SO5 TaxID=1897055 RepID=UPI001E2B6139|nr:hypothetical protein [Arthrobacter sp. SO5]MCB5273327.1 hypothetical protein [Arthrobacter sp. SO5]
MEHGVRDSKRTPVAAASVGFAAVATYAIAGALQILVWNPLAAVPGASLREIYAAMESARESLAAPLVFAWSLAGITLAVGVLIGTLLARKPVVRQVIAGYLGLLVLAAPTHWYVAFPGGMGIADAFNTSGGDHTPWGGLLYAVSAAALLALVGIAVEGRRRRNVERLPPGEEE